MEDSKSFNQKYQRIMLATGVGKDSELARALGIKAQSIAAAKKREQIPSGWIEAVAEKYKVKSDWLFFGTGEMHNDTPRQDVVATDQAASANCPKCTELESELKKEREEVRELYKENRILLKERGELKAEVATLKGENKLLENKVDSFCATLKEETV